MSDLPLVSILIPAYKGQYFERTLASACRQTYPNLEIVVCDDSSGTGIEQFSREYAASVAFPIRYSRNQPRLGERGNLARCIAESSGKYVKFLHDDDILRPDCVERLVQVMEDDPGISLATSRRQLIDEEDNPVPDILATIFPFASDTLLDGDDLISFLADHTINFIGEPSCVMCRREDIAPFGARLMDLNGKHIDWVADLALYANLLQHGNLAMLAEPLTSFRVSVWQSSQVGRDTPGIGDKGHADFRQAVRDLGWYREGQEKVVRVAPITQLKARVFKRVNVLDSLYRAAGYGSVSLANWLQVRRPSAVQQHLIQQRLGQYAGGPKIALLLVSEEGDLQALERTLGSLASTNLYPNLDVLALLPSTLANEAGGCRRIALRDEGVAATINATLNELSADWLLVAEAGVEFTPSGLLLTALELLNAPDGCLAVYADEVVRLAGDECGLALRPDLNLDMLLSFPSGLSRHWLFRREALLAREGFVGQAFELEYQLRLIHELGFGCVGHVAEPLLAADAGYLRDDPVERAVIEQHLHARGYAQAQVGSRLPGRYELDYGHGELASVSILVEVRGRLAGVQRCVESVLENTAHAGYELLLLQGGEDPEVIAH